MARISYTAADYLMTGEDSVSSAAEKRATQYGKPLDGAEREIIDLYRDAPPDGQAAARAVFEIYRKKEKR